MASKKEMLAQLASHTGVTRLLEALPGRASLLILNYHRIGDPTKTPYDSGLYSCTAEEFDWQLDWLKRRFPIVNLRQAVDIVHGEATPSDTSVLLTFDDGYRDNYDEAFPLLRKHGLSATFFLPTLYVGSHMLPWWDEAAYMIKKSERPTLAISYPKAHTWDLANADRLNVIFEVLRMFIRTKPTGMDRFLQEIECATGVERPGEHTERCFLTWIEAREMQTAGMCFGSHTHSHVILGPLPFEQQVEELRVSRQIMEAELGGVIDTLAYPRGRMSSFSDQTFAALRETKYKTAFSYYSGINKPGSIHPLDVLREPVEVESRNVFRLRHATYASLGRGVV